VITGGDSGIGFGVAMGVAAAGATLIMLGFHKETALAAAHNITRDTGNKQITVIAPFDLGNLSSIRETVTKVKQQAAQIDVLVCDAGLNYEHHGQEITGDGFESTFQVTFLGHFVVVRAAAPFASRETGPCGACRL
jgi:NAD(P)-dependent dehydrogenase (short-subunit alcohol dehydrogenase family)